MQVLYTLYTDLASKNLNYFSLFYSFLSFDVRVAILFIFYSNIRPAQLNSSYKRNQTLHLFVCVCARACVSACVCVNGICACLQCAPRPFVVSSAAYSKVYVYSLCSSPPSTSSLFTERNVVLILI